MPGMVLEHKSGLTFIIPYNIQHTQGTLLVPPHAIWTQDVPGCFPDVHDQITDRITWNHSNS